MDVECDECSTIRGNREAYQLLKAKIDELLESGESRVLVEGGGVAIGQLELRDRYDLRELPRTPWQKFTETLLVLLVLSIPVSVLLFAIFGLIQLIHILS